MHEKNFYIVCVDDDKDVLDVTSQKVKDLGYVSIDFTNVSDAVEYINKNKHIVSLILSDLRMDNINGFDFKKLLLKTANEIPFVVITGYWTKEISAEAMGIGIDAFIEKPISDTILKENIEKFADIRAEVLAEEKEMVEGFLEETLPMLDEIEQLILELEEDPTSEQTLSIYFRLLHTIKGTASCVGLLKLGAYTHAYEDFIGELRNKVIPVNTQTTNTLLEGLDDLKSYFSEILREGADTHIVIDGKIKKYSAGYIESGETSQTEERKTERTEKNQVKKKGDEKMAVPMTLLDDFVEASGELTVIRNSIFKTVKKIEMKYRGDHELEILGDLLDGMYDVTSSIQGKISEMRKKSLKNTFRPFKRLIRDLSKQLGKKVELEIEGEDLYVDNVVTKLFSNTLIHLLRNSLDHGLEKPEVRERAGKSSVGQLSISVTEEGEDIVLHIIDDGHGINPCVIKKIAIEKELYTQEQIDRMSDTEIINIIFASGFSTAQTVSDLSGRGVGMDMVRSSFLDMGGNVFVQSEVGKGSTFTLRVPAPKSVLIISTLSIRVGREFFIFHMDEVSEVIRYESEAVNSKMYTVDNKLVLNHNDNMIQLLKLSDTLSIESDQSEHAICNIVVLKVKHLRFGVIVDEINEFEEVVSRKISEDIKSSDLYHGASLIGNGEVAMILSSEGIARQQGFDISVATSQEFIKKDSAIQEGEKEFDEFMLFKYADDKFLSISIDDVVRLEKIDPQKIQKVGRNFITRYLDKVLPIIEPAFVLGLTEDNLETTLQNYKKDLLEIIVVTINEKQYGIFVQELNDIQKSYEPMSCGTIKNKGLKGSVFIDNKTICVLNLEYIQEKYNKKEKMVRRKFSLKNEERSAA